MKSRRLGVAFGAETGFIIRRDPDTVRAPDVAFIAAERVPAGKRPAKFWPIVPDLVVEIISPSDVRREVEEKIMDWLKAGVPLAWVVNPSQRSVTVYVPGAKPRILQSTGTLDGGDVLPGFTLPLGDIFS